jgi:transforming growth factor-beta-induced protein
MTHGARASTARTAAKTGPDAHEGVTPIPLFEYTAMRPFMTFTATALVAALSASAQAQCDSAETGVSNSVHASWEAPASDLVDTAVAAGSFNTLVTAVQTAGLVDALRADGPFTVFAPDDAAFARLPDGTVEGLLQEGNRALLGEILTYHVVPGALRAEDVVQRDFLETLNGQRLAVSVDDSGVRIAGVPLQATDIETSNGVIHVLSGVMLPSDDDLVATAVAAGGFETLAAALQAAGLVKALQGDGPFTVFAPTDEAFAALPEGTVASLLEPANRQTLVDILKLHVVSGRVFADQAVAARRAKALSGGTLSLGIRDGRVYVNDARIVATDLAASNGVIHVIDTVLLP